MAKNSTKRPDKIIPNGRPSGSPGATGIMGTMQSPPVAERVYGPDYEKYTTKQGYDAYRKKSKKKKAKPVGKGKKGKGPS